MRYLETVMGVPMSLDLRAPADDRSRAAARAAFDLLRAEDARFSPFRPSSELLSRNGLNRASSTRSRSNAARAAARARSSAGARRSSDIGTPMTVSRYRTGQPLASIADWTDSR